ncbi:extracellular solute-binding protein [Microlunatus speluncae]|uniref:extracellular solute-binding protein n=1 Tax=Microlunatus speluncae TaxID=2594267 RepID=UPI0013758A36|nr:extracellular solute-binding protein [Microlunatus speluncae]
MTSNLINNLSRRAFLGTAGAAAVAGLAGCGGSSSRDNDGGPGGGGGGSAKLQFMFWGSAFEKTAIEQMIKGFEGAHSGVTVDPIHVPGDYQTKVNTLVASDDLPDVAYMDAPTAYRLAEQGKITNIYPYIEKFDQLSGRQPANFFWYGDKQVAGTPGASEISLIWYNKALFSGGTAMPPASADQAWSWDELLQTATLLTLDQDGRNPTESGFKGDNIRQFGLSAPVTTQWTWYPLIRSNGGDITDETGMKYTLNSPECVEVFQNLQDLVYKHKVAPSPAQLGGADGANAPTTTVLLQTKRVAMVLDGQWTLLDLGKSDLDYSLGVLPSYQQPFTMEAGSCRIMSANTASPEQAIELYVYSVDGSNSDLFSQGLWMPVETKYYSDDAAINSWIGNDVHPPEYRTAAVDYRLNNSIRDWTQTLKNVPAIQEVVTPAMQEIATGSRPAKEVLDGLKDKVEPLLKGKYTIPDSL